ncbi:hypothetical protein A6R68_14418 [Neotoma lepida]|uniref:Uncharacterized protein n=1 Tax=Neotoma lepida TaxID=56216 RepID=A0A1A6H9T4_NEOLE|nr:hypothetical protein A6R68_14418 [Neotoma lepida]
MTDKLTPIYGHIFRCCSGSAPDTQAIANAVTYQVGFHSIELNEPPLGDVLPIQRRSDASAFTLVMEWDSSSGGMIHLATIQESGVEQQPLGPAPQDPFKEACGRWHAQQVIVPLVIHLASDNFVQGWEQALARFLTPLGSQGKRCCGAFLGAFGFSGPQGSFEWSSSFH